MTFTAYESSKVEVENLLFKESTSAEFIFLVKSGTLLTVKEQNGRLVPTGTHKKGDFLGVSGGINRKVYDESCFTIEDVEVVPIPISEVSKIIDSNELWLKKIVNTTIDRLDSAINILAEHKIFDTAKSSDFVFSDEIEAKFRKLINE